MHKFKSGDLVQFQTGFLQPRTASGVYTVVRVLPASPDGHLQYQTRGLTAELLGRGIKSDRRAVWVFLHAEGLSFKKNRAAGRADAARHRPQADALEGPSGS